MDLSNLSDSVGYDHHHIKAAPPFMKITYNIISVPKGVNKKLIPSDPHHKLSNNIILKIIGYFWSIPRVLRLKLLKIC